MCALAARVGYHMIMMGETYSAMANRQQTKDIPVLATRGSILDCNGNELAISATTNTVWVRPDSVKGSGKTEDEIELNIYNEAKILSRLLGMDIDEVKGIITSDRKLVKLAKNVDNELADRIREEELCGIEISEDAKRYYPLGSFASHILGTTTDDNAGLLGLERYYDRYLSGIDGRWITSRGGDSNTLSYGTSRYHSERDGWTLVTTIDENIQYIVEQEIARTLEDTGALRVSCLMMEPRTAAIIAMAQTDNFDPNNPRDPIGDDEEKSAFAVMTESERIAYWNRIWRNFCVSDAYEPGSTFKLITTAIALEEGVSYLDDIFYCNSSIQVADAKLKCWNYPHAHGKQTLVQAVENSCNPVMVQLAQRLGLRKYYGGLDAFGLTEKTGIDYPGEGYNILQNRSTAGPVGLATMAFGQGIAMTPVSLVTAISALANEGKLMRPHFMKAFIGPDGELIESFEPLVTSVPVSAQTADDMLKIMEEVVGEGGGGSARIAGYRIGGKTGTAQKPVPGGYSETDYYSSFLGIAPIDNPRFTILVVVDTPRGKIYGSQTAAPCAKRIMQRVFTYMGIEPNYTKAEIAAMNRLSVKVPDLSGRSAEAAVGILEGRGLGYIFAPETEQYDNLLVVDQFPKPGGEISKGSSVTLYYEEILGESPALVPDMEMLD